MTLERIEHKVFASEAPLEEMGQFGSALATTKLNTKDVAEIQALPAYTKGWGSAIISENNYPAMEEMNGVLNVMSYHTGYLYQEGIPTYSATQEYSVTSWVKDLAGEKVYKSLQGGNKGHDLIDPAWWEELKLGGGGLEIGDIGFTQMAIDETKGKRRVLNGQLIIQEQYIQFTNIIKNSVALNPSLACTEAEWQTAVTMSANGVCEKFVIDDNAGTIRLPKYPQYLDLTINTSGASAVSQTVSVYGDGKSLGLTNGSKELCLTNAGNGVGAVAIPYNATVGNTGTSYYTTAGVMGVNISSSKSGLTGKVTIPAVAGVTSEKIKGTYFIQVATGAEVEDNIVNDIELNNPFFLGMSQYFETAPNNSSWLKSEGQWNAKAVYPTVYDWALINANNGIEGFKLVTDTYTDYDYVINTADETFRLPLLNGSEDIINWKLHPITIAEPWVAGTDYIAPKNGAFQVKISSTETGQYLDFNVNDTFPKNRLATVNNENINDYIEVKRNDVLNLNTNMGGSKTALYFYPAIGNGSLYFYVGETVQNANLVNVGRIQETYATKSMVDGQWVNKALVLVSNVACPNSDLSLDLSSWLPNDGYIYEILCDVTGRTGSTSGDTSGIAVTSDILLDNGFNVVIAQTRSASTISFATSFTIPIGTERYLRLVNGVGANTGTFTLVARAYRRLGTNL